MEYCRHFTHTITSTTHNCVHNHNGKSGRTFNISRALVGNTFVDHSEVDKASPVFILDLTPGFIGLGKDIYKTRPEAFQFCNLVRLYVFFSTTDMSCIEIGISAAATKVFCMSDISVYVCGP